MRNMNFLKIIVASFLLGISGKALANEDASALAAIIQLERRDAKAAMINDIDTLVSLWTDDGVLLIPASPPIVGISAIRSILETQKQRSAAVRTLSYDEDWTERHINGNEAWEWGSISVTLQLPDGRQVIQKAFMLRILSRQPDGSWKFARAIGTPAPKTP
ncbi:MAG TPA: DUF4440 domain-containing protein [Terriglobales bacterium]|nr:DUF4440 domain-containing protein [Terriglobales bacterium]